MFSRLLLSQLALSKYQKSMLRVALIIMFHLSYSWCLQCLAEHFTVFEEEGTLPEPICLLFLLFLIHLESLFEVGGMVLGQGFSCAEFVLTFERLELLRSSQILLLD